MRAVRTLVVVSISLAGLIWVSGAAALIVPGHSIAGIELQMTRPEVKAAKGEPNRIVHGSNDFGPYTEFLYGKLKVTFQGNAGATAVSTRRRGQYTAERIHVGSSETRLRAAYPRALCRTEGAGFRHCWTGRFRPGRRVTDYRISLSTMKVKSVLVGFVID